MRAGGVNWHDDVQGRTGLSGCTGVKSCVVVEGCASVSRFVDVKIHGCVRMSRCGGGTLVCEKAWLDQAVELYARWHE